MKSLKPKSIIGFYAIKETKDVIKWGFYERDILLPYGLGFQKFRVKIQRYMNKRTGETFSILPGNLLPYTKVTKDYLKGILDAKFWIGASLRKMNGKAGHKFCSVSTVWSHLNKLNKKSKEEFKGIISNFSGVLCIDEVWIKVKGKWRFGTIAVDGITGMIIAVDVLISMKKRFVKKFLMNVKKLVNPKLILTDMHETYIALIPKLFPKAKHQWCIFHIMRAIYRNFRKTYGKKNKTMNRIRDLLINAFQLEKKRDCKNVLTTVIKDCLDFLKKEARHIVSVIKENLDQILTFYETKIKTNNAMEHLFARFKPIYKVMKCFMSLESARNFFSSFSLYRNFEVYERGKRSGFSPYDLAKAKLSGDYYFYMLH